MDSFAKSAAPQTHGSTTGRSADSPLQIPARGWKQVVVRTWKESSQDNIGIVAAGVAFYGFLALVPLLGAIVLTYGIAADPQTVLSDVRSLTSVLPSDVAKLIGQQLMSIVHTSGSKKGIGLVVAIAVALWGARNAATSIITALNIAYEEKETRSMIRVNLLALAITAGGVVIAVLALLAITALGFLNRFLPHAPGPLVAAGKLLSYVLLFFGAAAGAATLYRYAPARHEAKWEWITPGSIFAAALWLLLTFAFGVYVSQFGNYNETYGSLATVVILVTWLYLSAYVFLLSAELNSELERQTASDTTVEGSKPCTPGVPREKQEQLSDEPSDSTSRQSAGEDSARSTRSHSADLSSGESKSPSAIEDYVAARAANRAVSLTGLRAVGLVSAVVSTFGLSLLRKKGKAGAGAVLVATAAGLSFLRRGD